MTTLGIVEVGTLAEDLKARIELRTARVCVVGLGYVGLPLAETFAWGGYPVLGFDIDQTKVEKLKRGESYIGHICPERVTELVGSGRFDATTEASSFAEADAIIICVPTPLTESREPDLSYVADTGRMLHDHLRPGQLVVLESTTYPGTTRTCCGQSWKKAASRRTRFLPRLQSRTRRPRQPRFRHTQHSQGGRRHRRRQPRSGPCLVCAVVEGVVAVSSTQVAEACKILENTYRCVNIALVNELKVVFDAMGIDVWEVIAAAKTKPFGFQAFYPGPGLGGHCIPIDPFYLTWAARKYGVHTRFIELAGEINTSMPQRVVERLAEALNEQGKPLKGSRVCVLGVAYKKDVDDPRESPAFPILEMLQRAAPSFPTTTRTFPNCRGCATTTFGFPVKN